MKILLVKFDNIGDGIIFSSIIKPIKEGVATAEIDILCQYKCMDIYKLNPYIEDIIFTENNKIPNLGKEYDILINGHYSRTKFTDILCNLLKAKEKYAFLGDHCNISPQDKLIGNNYYNDLVETQENLELYKYRDLLKQIFNIDIKKEDLKPELYFKSRIDEYNLPKRFAVLVPYSAYPYKDYPEEKFYNALKDYPLDIVILGTEEQKEKANYFSEKNKKFINLCGKTTLLECMDIINNSEKVFGVDTGLIHVASALNKENIVVVGQGHWKRFLPWSSSTKIVTGYDRYEDICPHYNCNWRCRYGNFQCVKMANLEDNL
jgi:ADP-heptose:LPS heptosyltransferase